MIFESSTQSQYSDSFIEKEVFILTDSRIGNSKQAISLAKILGLFYKELYLSYNILANLPNFIPLLCLGLESSCRAKVMQSAPKLVISSGRRSARVALALKRKYGCKIIQIMNPNLPFTKFDSLILPAHDKKEGVLDYQNIIYVNGAISYINWNEIKSLDKINALPSPKIAILVGGSSKSVSFTEEDLIALLQAIDRATENIKKTGIKPSIMLTNSRRTPPIFMKRIQTWLSQTTDHFILYDVHKPELNLNPYMTFLRDADVIVATGDSISMCSEILLANKELYIYKPSKISTKHEKYLQKNLAQGNFKDICSKNANIDWSIGQKQKQVLTGSILDNNLLSQNLEPQQGVSYSLTQEQIHNLFNLIKSKT